MQLLTLDELKRKREVELDGSLRAIRDHWDTYREIKKLIDRINGAPLDVGDYHHTATRLGSMLVAMSSGIDCTIFNYFAHHIDPGKAGDVRCFRLECRDLAEQMRQLDQRRTGRQRLRRVK
ncbi:MAG: hypothetical protein KFF50_16560 [Desulfatitalea sp.]|nr:hypothetical protein [Desulfatitalea sp.]